MLIRSLATKSCYRLRAATSQPRARQREERTGEARDLLGPV